MALPSRQPQSQATGIINNIYKYMQPLMGFIQHLTLIKGAKLSPDQIKQLQSTCSKMTTELKNLKNIASNLSKEDQKILSNITATVGKLTTMADSGHASKDFISCLFLLNSEMEDLSLDLAPLPNPKVQVIAYANNLLGYCMAMMDGTEDTRQQLNAELKKIQQFSSKLNTQAQNLVAAISATVAGIDSKGPSRQVFKSLMSQISQLISEGHR